MKSTFEEYKAQIKFSNNKRMIIGRKKFKELIKPNRIFDHMIIANMTSKNGVMKLDEVFRPEGIRYTPIPNERNNVLTKIQNKAFAHSGELIIREPLHNETIAALNIEFNVSSFNYMFELHSVMTDLLSEENEITFDIYIYFVRYEKE